MKRLYFVFAVLLAVCWAVFPEAMAANVHGLGAVGLLAVGRLRELRDQRGQLIHDARALVDKADAEKRALTDEETAKYNDIFAKQEELRGRIEREEQLAEAERQAAERALENRADQRTGDTPDEEQRSAFRKALVSGVGSLSSHERRALQADSDTQGGFLVAPQQWVAELIKAVDDIVFIRARARKFQVRGAASLGAPSMTARASDAEWTPEINIAAEDSQLAFGRRELMPRKLSKLVKISNQLMMQSPMAENIVLAEMAYIMGISQEKSFLTGSGAGQPLGVFTASATGITTARDVSTGNTATAPTMDGLISAKYALKGQYWGNAEWIFHRDVLAGVSKLKDGEGQYMWRQSTRDGEPDTLLGRPVNMSEYAPNTMTTGQYVGIVGDFSKYWIADSLDFQVQRLMELFAASDETGFIGRAYTDGMPVLAEAFARVKLA